MQEHTQETTQVNKSRSTFAREVYERLSAINVNQHTEKKGNLTYLSWAWAWQVLLQNYPESTISEQREERLPDGSVMIYTTLTVQEDDNQLSRTIWLPVMNHQNRSIINPSARDISDSRMRCLVKCIAMFGLGLYIYAGEDLPANEQEERDEAIRLAIILKSNIGCIETIGQYNDAYQSMMSLKERINDQLFNELAVLMKQKMKYYGFVFNKEDGSFVLQSNKETMQTEGASA